MLLHEFSGAMTQISFAAARRPSVMPSIRVAFAAFALALPAAAGAQQGIPVLHPADESQSAGAPVLLDAMTTE
jgi:hypothetical protein